MKMNEKMKYIEKLLLYKKMNFEVNIKIVNYIDMNIFDLIQEKIQKELRKFFILIKKKIKKEKNK